MKRKVLWSLTTAILASLQIFAACGKESVSVREPADTVGYATTARAVEELLEYADSVEAEKYAENEMKYPFMAGDMLAAICPHDDYLYAASVYSHVFRHIRAPVVVMFGVSHAARRMGIEGKLIFDSFSEWKGPYGNIPVDGLRDELVEALPRDMVLVDDDMHAREHSLEAFIPFIQYTASKRSESKESRIKQAASKRSESKESGIKQAASKRSESKESGIKQAAAKIYQDKEALPARIVPLLVTRFAGSTQRAAADTLAALLAKKFEERGWILGRDVQILISADCVHYGDEAWGGRGYAPFGVNEAGYGKAVDQEMKVVDSSLTGPIGPSNIETFRSLVERDDLEWPYKIPWCGVYSIPFGLSALHRLRDLEGERKPEGALLRYATSLEPGRIGMESTWLEGLGVTNIATLRHWVGYAAIGYW